ncbi:TetR/AcrR family transcriptional regulator [Eubacterium limosum]|uniref:TetR/AcrR family transcriptional regulator n=1 Tax=Eubacterium limosum TaxID=1736 RepID=A0ABT5UV83_EUBLI|nr:TetR/AcrR family transcriptional regulator [Eubacterium limosum]MCB6570678.1 TetR/AcrR family transcriptional regulator [Eubacterium limosum]MDE1471860.1 TetR/AcrR family transcriptional regulator [Eubacterium limosum]
MTIILNYDNLNKHNAKMIYIRQNSIKKSERMEKIMSRNENNREIILDNALKLFYEKGYENTSLREIAKMSDIAHTSIFNHFKNKAEIASILLSRFISSLIKLTERYLEEMDSKNNSKTAYLFYWSAHFYFISNEIRFYSYYYKFSDKVPPEQRPQYLRILFQDLMKFEYECTDQESSMHEQIVSDVLGIIENEYHKKALDIAGAIALLTDIIIAATKIDLQISKEDIEGFIADLDYEQYVKCDVLQDMILTNLGTPFNPNNNLDYD